MIKNDVLSTQRDNYYKRIYITNPSKIFIFGGFFLYRKSSPYYKEKNVLQECAKTPYG